MSSDKGSRVPLLPLQGSINNTLSIVGTLDEWESTIIDRYKDDFGHACFEIAEKQTSISRALEWLQIGAVAGNGRSILLHTALTYDCLHDVDYKLDEAALLLSQVKEEKRKDEKRELKLFKYFKPFDPRGARARRSFTRTLLSGSLEKNKDSAIHQSFFKSGLRETYLIPVVCKYLERAKGDEEIQEEEDEEEEEEEEGKVVLRSRQEIKSSLDIAHLLLFDYSSVSILYHRLSFLPSGFLMSFLSHFLSRLPSLKTLVLEGPASLTPTVLSQLIDTDTSKLEEFCILNCEVESLSSLSLCDFSSLQKLVISLNAAGTTKATPSVGWLSNELVRSLKVLHIRCIHLNDISPLSGCDLSSLEVLSFDGCRSLSDLSPLRGKDLSSLRSLHLHGTAISDLSPLCECERFAPEHINIRASPIVDLSPLSQLDFSHLKRPIDLRNTHILDLTPLENISADDVCVLITWTPALTKMLEEGLDPDKSYHAIGKVRVEWK